MLNWIKKILRLRSSQVKEEQSEGASPPPHFHVDRHPHVNLPDFTEFEKIDVDIWARENHGIKLDRRKSKNNMIEELRTKLESKES